MAANVPPMSYEDNFLTEAEITELTEALRKLPFMQSEHVLFDRECKSSVHYCWLTDTGLPYIFGASMTNALIPHFFEDFPEIDKLRRKIEARTNLPFNSVLVNFYKDGNTSLGAHSDDDPWLSDRFIVPSVSIGAARFFDVTSKSAVRTKRTPSGKPVSEEKHRYVLKSGSLVIMGEDMQRGWVHAIPKQKKAIDDAGKRLKTDTGFRFNLTFRNVIPELARRMPSGRKPKNSSI
jgi:alkylated DNA repair dioxygenase AlkB